MRPRLQFLLNFLDEKKVVSKDFQVWTLETGIVDA